MRVVIGLCLAFTAAIAAPAERKDFQKKNVPAAPSTGIKTPGVQIPFASVKSELVFDLDSAATWFAATDTVWIPAKDGLRRVDPKGKESKFGEPVAGLDHPCAGLVSAFTSLWIPNCGKGTISRVEAKGGKVTATLAIGAGPAMRSGIAATADSAWAFTDSKGTVSRIDPVENKVVAEFRVFSDCNTLAFGETALWLTCPAENKVLRVDAATNLVDKTIEVSAHPAALAIGETSVWVLCEKDGKIDRIDPKTNKVTKTIDLGAPATGGSIAIGEGSLWVSMPGFPVTRVDAASEKVVQQFWGEGAGVVQAALGSVWLADAQSGKLLKLDPKRIAATLAE